MANPVVIAKNTTVADIFLTRVGVNVPALSNVTLCGAADAPAHFYEVAVDDVLITKVTAGDITINDGSSDLSSAEGLAYLDASGNMNGPVTGAATNRMVKLADATGRFLEIADNALWPTGAADPAGAPSDGDMYFNTTLDMWMSYDAGRGKWLSFEGDTFQVGQNGNVPVGTYFKGVAGKTLSASLGYTAPYNGTIITMTFSKTDSNSSDLEIMATGVQIGAVTTGAVTSGFDNTVDSDFSQGDILAVRNDAAGAQLRDVQCWVRMKWRA